MNKFKRNCPECKIILFYNRKWDRDEAIRKNRLCRNCYENKNKNKDEIFKRNCSECDKILTYTDKWYRDDAEKKNRKCRSCSKTGILRPNFWKNLSIEGKLKLNKTWFKKGSRPLNADTRKGKTLEEIHGVEKALKIRKLYSERKHTYEENLKRSISCKRAGCGLYNKGRRCSDENKKRFRILMIERLRATNKSFHPGYNKEACYYFDKIMELTKTNIQHALNDGEFCIEELGYWVDGYDKENNIVYEFDEKRHYDIYGNLKEKDKVREFEITQHLNCVFIRINQRVLQGIKNE